MIRMRLSEAAGLLDATSGGEDVVFAGVSTDSRTLDPGRLFVALVGPRFDGHEFLSQARARGAAAALVQRRPAKPLLPMVEVEDTLAALGQLAASWRGRFSLPLVGITGSNGKTTVKEMLAGILGEMGPTLATRGNLNNEIGVPLTLLWLEAAHRSAVIEMGANGPGEIGRIARMARPGVGVITQCAPAHIEGFGSIEGVARAKGELVESLGRAGTAVINVDDAYAGLWRELAGTRACLGFGFGADADVRVHARPTSSGSRLHLDTPLGPLSVALPLPGRHNALNAAAAAAAAIAVGCDAQALVAGLEAVRPVAGRLEPKRGLSGTTVLDDSYNANPTSLAAGLAVLAERPGRRWLVLADMAELGLGAPEFHRQAGLGAREAGVERLYALGDLAGLAAGSFGAGARAFDRREELVAALREDLEGPLTVLVKGSRSMGMERVVAAITATSRPG